MDVLHRPGHAPRRGNFGPTHAPIAPRPPVGEPTPARYLERGPALASPSEGYGNLSVPLEGEDIEPTPDPREVRQRLKNELIAEEEARQEKELTCRPLSPPPRPWGEHPNVQQLARPHAVFSRRGPAEIKTDEEGNEESFFGIPKLVHKPPVTKSRAYEPKSYGGFSLSTKDINVRRKK